MDSRPVRFAVFGLTVSSTWANGHATLWRALLKGLHAGSHEVTFFERDVPYYAEQRDLPEPDFCDLVLYTGWSDVESRARAAVADADVAIVTSYCPDGLAACRLILDAPRTTLRVFYDMDTPVTLAALEQHGLAVPDGARYLTPDLIGDFDLYLSFTGGPILDAVQRRWGARRVAPLYGSVDPDVHAPIANPPDAFRCALGYLGTYAADRQPSLERLLIEPARRRPAERFAVAGSMYPASVGWPPNVALRWHLDAADHPAFYSGSRLTLNVTRAQMLEWGYTPSGRIFEAAACGTPVLSDRWPGIDVLFTPGADILVADTPEDVEAVLSLTANELTYIAAAARERVLAHHTGAARARELVATCERVTC